MEINGPSVIISYFYEVRLVLVIPTQHSSIARIHRREIAVIIKTGIAVKLFNPVLGVSNTDAE